jgi:hypothetical protein
MEVFGIAHCVCSRTPPRRRRSWITPQSRGASPGTRIEEIATVSATSRGGERNMKGKCHA